MQRKLCLTATQKRTRSHPRPFFGLYSELFPRIKPFANVIGNYTCHDSRKNVPKKIVHSATPPFFKRVVQRTGLIIANIFSYSKMIKIYHELDFSKIIA